MIKLKPYAIYKMSSNDELIEVNVWTPRKGWFVLNRYSPTVSLAMILDHIKESKAKNVRIRYPIEGKVNILVFSGDVLS